MLLAFLAIGIFAMGELLLISVFQLVRSSSTNYETQDSIPTKLE